MYQSKEVIAINSLLLGVMDIRKFLKPLTQPQQSIPDVEDITLTPVCKKRKTDTVACSSGAATLPPEPDPDKLESGDTMLTYDIGNYVKSTTKIAVDLKYRLLTDPYKPQQSYDFEGDISGSGKRCFRESWLTKYSPWLSYSPRLKGAFCIFCVLFPQPVQRGIQGAFITTPCTKYKDFNECARNHISSAWHRGSQQDAEHFTSTIRDPNKVIICQVDNSVKRIIEENRKKLYPIISTILFCGTNDLAIRGKNSTKGNAEQLYAYRIEGGDSILKNHFDTAAENARYTSHRTQNDLINMSEQALREDIVKAANNAVGFSIIADETADISGTEQLSLGVRFVDTSSEQAMIREEFLGFSPLKDMDAATISDCIIEHCKTFGLLLNNLLGQGYDGCSTMAGKENGVQAKIRSIYPKAAFVHCASHRLNLVVNDLNNVAVIRNTIGTIKAIITFFRESPKRRSSVPNIPLLCETRWTSKYKSIRIFSSKFEDIYCQLEEFSLHANGNTRQAAHQLYCSSKSSTFLFCLNIISQYSAILEPVTQALQAVQVDLPEVQLQVQNLLSVIKLHRGDSDNYFRDIFEKTVQIAQKVDIELIIPRQCGRQKHRSNPETTSVEEYFRQTVYIPYLDSLISSIESRFCDANSAQFNLTLLHPSKLYKLNRQQFKDTMSTINQVYHIDNFESEALSWFDFWKTREYKSSQDFLDLLPFTKFYPAVRYALLVLLTLPATTCTVERSFSTLRRVKTWLRSTMSDERLSGLCMLSVHRDKVNGNKKDFMDKIVDMFGRDNRRLQFLFKE